MDHPTGSWLCPTEGDRARMLEAGARVRVTRLVAAFLNGALFAVCGPWFGWWPLAFFALTAIQLLTLERRTAVSPRPERMVALSFVSTSVLIAASSVVTGGPASPLLPLVVLPAALMANRFRRAVVWTGFAGSALLIAAVGLTQPAALADDPTYVLAALGTLAGIVFFTMSLSDTELQLRHESRFDHLTGLLNRAALGPRWDELETQARATDGSVALVVYDLDRFKQVNDVHGHDVGDVVLRETAEVLRSQLRAFDLVYRLGGEEFVLVLPGAGVGEAQEIADRQRAAVAARRPGGIAVTISAGISAGRGDGVGWEELYRRADAALLQAKRDGRDRVVVDATSADLLLTR
ncbi:MAG: GGDEF domain-containing protein [Solirubrobacterales bacterium]|nr:GGDEF domain-containing protein [Solirubrobacterales bacterium]